jgi:putative sigma-54 modulation protein
MNIYLFAQVENAHRIEVVALLKGTTIACHKASPDMYHSIDAAAHALNRKLRKYKENRVNGWHGTEKLSDDMMAAFGELEAMELPEEDANYDEFELLEDPEKPVITKVKSFDLENPIRLEEAIFALDYVDHDFYVFKNAETDKISVVYKRKVGGVGLIEP